MAARRDPPWLLLALGGGAALLLLTQRKTVMLYGSKALQAGNEAAFRAALPDHADPYASVILAVAKETGVDPFLIFALGDRESRWGEALSPRGPGGKGDAGHGHGIMQIDDRSFGPWLAVNDWRDPYVNVRKGAEILKGKMRFFEGNSKVQGYTDGRLVSIDKSAARLGVEPGFYPDPRPLSGERLFEAAVAAYNTGEANVLLALAAGRPAETTTANGDYFTDVWSRMIAAANRMV